MKDSKVSKHKKPKNPRQNNNARSKKIKINGSVYDPKVGSGFQSLRSKSRFNPDPIGPKSSKNSMSLNF